MASELVPIPPTPRPSRRIVLQTSPFRFASQLRAELADQLDTGDDAETTRVVSRIEQHVWLYRERRAIGAVQDRRARSDRAWLKNITRQADRLTAAIRTRLPDDEIVLPFDSTDRGAVAALRTALEAFRRRAADDGPDLRIDDPYELALTCAIADILDGGGWPIGKGATSPLPGVLHVVLTALARSPTPGVVNRLILEARTYLPEWRAQSIDEQFSPTWRLLRNIRS